MPGPGIAPARLIPLSKPCPPFTPSPATTLVVGEIAANRQLSTADGSRIPRKRVAQLQLPGPVTHQPQLRHRAGFPRRQQATMKQLFIALCMVAAASAAALPSPEVICGASGKAAGGARSPPASAPTCSLQLAASGLCRSVRGGFKHITQPTVAKGPAFFFSAPPVPAPAPPCRPARRLGGRRRQQHREL